MYKIGFIMEQVLGHITVTQNLQYNLPADPSVEAHWGLVTWHTPGWTGLIPIYRSNWTIRAGLRARRLVANMRQQTQLDALFFHTQVPAMLALDHIRHIPSIISLDATPLQYDRLGNAYGHSRNAAWIEGQKAKLHRSCFHAARRLVTFSEWAKQGLIDDYQVPPDKVVVIPPGVNVGEWRRATPRSLHAGPVKILFVGGDFERKGGWLLLEAFRTLRPLDVELHIVTSAPLPPEPGLFVYTNVQPNSPLLKQLYHDSDIFCLPTLGDCAPNVLSEAAAAGLPLISTRLAAIPEIVKDGETGFLVPVDDVAALAEILRQLVRQPELCLQYGQNAFELVGRKLDAHDNAKCLVDLLKETVDEGRRSIVTA